jgi:anti-sigma regulatory factor (Ser/Thr protein kinase)
VSVARRPALEPNPFVHEAFFYAGADEYIDGTTTFIRSGLEADDVVLVAVPASNAQLIKAGLGRRAERVEFLDMADVGGNPGRIIPVWLHFVAENAEAGRTVRGIGEPIWAGRSAAALVECQWHESLLNLAFAGVPALPLMCPYDTGSLEPEVVLEAERSHPYLRDSSGRRDSVVYRGAPAADDDLDLPLSAVPVRARTFAFAPGELNAVRTVVDAYAADAGLPPERASDLVLAANEAATNSIRHGGGHGVVRVWASSDAVVCEVSDSGRIAKAMVGRHFRSVHAVGGRGIWLVHQLCDLVEVRSGAEGTTVRMSVYRRRGLSFDPR